MKNIIRLTLALFFVTLYSATLNAQNNPQRQRMTREQLAEAQAKYIARELAFDDVTSNKFIKTYCDFQKEVWALGPRMKPEKKNDMTDEEARKLINDRFEQSQKRLALHEKYYKKYSSFLTQKQIQRVYELKRQMMKRLSKKEHLGQGRKYMSRRSTQ